MSTIIDDSNIHSLVNKYLENKSLLPNDLKDIPIWEWDVSLVTDMSNLFEGRTDFNEPLNNWNVSNVTNMESMFMECEIFDQPLNDWNVSNVTNMTSMFVCCY